MSWKPVKMQAAVLTAPKEIQIQRVSLPEPGDGEVRVRVEGCGVCGSNLGPWEGRPWFKYPFAPGATGHEGWGEVDAVGPGTTQTAVGERVAFLSYHAYAEYDIAKETALVRLPSSLAKTPFPGEALGCAFNVFRRCDIAPDHTVAIIGIGFLGALLTALCARAGARVIAISRRQFALELARSYGAQEIIKLENKQELVERVFKLTFGRG